MTAVMAGKTGSGAAAPTPVQTPVSPEKQAQLATALNNGTLQLKTDGPPL